MWQTFLLHQKIAYYRRLREWYAAHHDDPDWSEPTRLNRLGLIFHDAFVSFGVWMIQAGLCWGAAVLLAKNVPGAEAMYWHIILFFALMLFPLVIGIPLLVVLGELSCWRPRVIRQKQRQERRRHVLCELARTKQAVQEVKATPPHPCRTGLNGVDTSCLT